MNVISLLTPKSEVAFLYEDAPVRQGLQQLHTHSYTAVPVLSRDGRYTGTISEGDLLWYLTGSPGSLKEAGHTRLNRVLRKTFNPAVSVRVSMQELLDCAMNQSFIPVEDDRGYFIGIVTRQTILRRIAVPGLAVIEQTELQKDLERIMA